MMPPNRHHWLFCCVVLVAALCVITLLSTADAAIITKPRHATSQVNPRVINIARGNQAPRATTTTPSPDQTTKTPTTKTTETTTTTTPPPGPTILCNCSDSKHLVGEFQLWDPKTPHPTYQYFPPTLGHFIKKYYNEKKPFVDTDISREGHTIRAKLLGLFWSFSDFTTQHDIKYIIMHGSLLGWVFSQGALSYDEDHDFVLTPNNALKLSKLNQTTFMDGRYLVDVAPYWCSRQYDFWNAIEMRWVDTHTGLYIDLTSLTPHNVEDTGALPFKPAKQQRSRHASCYKSSKISKPGLMSRDVLTINRDVDCVMDKSQHTYLTTDIFPLLEIEYEGRKAWIPNNYYSVLSQEYGKTFNNMHFFRSYPVDHWWDFNLETNDWVLRMEYEVGKKTKGFNKLQYNRKHKANVELLPSPESRGFVIKTTVIGYRD